MKERGWKDVGYHYIILNGFPGYSYYKANEHFYALDGSIELGRFLDADNYITEDERGAHVYGWNGVKP